MPSRTGHTSRSFRDNRTDIWREIVERVGAGETLAAVLADAHMPTQAAVWAWRRGSAPFDAEVRAAIARGAWVRRYGFDEGKAAAVLARVRAGVRAGAPLAKALREPGMPSARTVAYWRATQGAFAAELWRLWRERAGERARANGRAAYRAFDRAEADRIIVRVGRGASLREVATGADGRPRGPSERVTRRWAREDEEFGRALGFARKVGEAARTKARAMDWAEWLAGRIVMGASLHSLAAAGEAPSRMTMWRWMRRFPEVRAAILEACEHREEWFSDKVLEVLEGDDGLSWRALKAELKPWRQQQARLKHRPGHRQARTWSRRKGGG